MNQITVITVTIVVFIAAATTISENEMETIFVTPSNKTLCPSEQCYTINELNTEVRINMNTAIYFLPGRHALLTENGTYSTLDFSYASYIKLSGDYFGDSNHISLPVIDCYSSHQLSSVYLETKNIETVVITELVFKNCGFISEDCTYVILNKVVFTNAFSTALNIMDVFFLNISKTKVLRNAELLSYHEIYVRAMQIGKTKNAFLSDIDYENNFGELVIEDSCVYFLGYININNNTGLAILITYSQLVLDTNSEFIVTNNTNANQLGNVDSLINMLESNFTFLTGSFLRIENNTATGCGGIRAMFYSYISFMHNSTALFLRNTGTNGGALALYQKSSLFFRGDNFSVTFIKNRARNKGGAIFVEDKGYLNHIHKYIIFPTAICYHFTYPGLSFTSNTAKIAGNEIFGGWIDWPVNGRLLNATIMTKCQCISSLIKKDDSSTISSNPVRVCVCTNSTPNCNITNHKMWLYPGQTLELEAVAVGQRYGTVPATVTAEYKDSQTRHFKRDQNIQSVGRYCTPLKFTIKSSNTEETVLLYTDRELAVPIVPAATDSERSWLLDKRPELANLFSQLSITFYLKQCPLGYVFEYTNNICTCHPTLIGTFCNIIDYSIQRPQEKWINATFFHIVHTNSTKHGILIHDHCPFDYCVKIAINFSLEYPDKQCDFNRSGILCGACKNNFSRVFGTSRCKRCSSLWVLFIVPAIILAGIALIVFLMLLDLTVSIGTINGLIFYANIVRANQAIFFPTGEINTFLNVFIAWLNLDLGLETCFYDGLDAYADTWLQFIFPLYIWLLVAIIIVSSHYSSTVSRWTGTNAVQVLATLFLLSYVKLLRLIITVFLSTDIVYPDSYHRRVWLYDGNVDYLKGKHIPLFIAALLALIILTVPYTTTLFTIQWLQRHKSCYRLLFWVHKLKPIFDAHTGPYKNRHRYWTGLLLLVRVGLLMIFTINLKGDPAVNLLTNIIIVLCLSLYFVFVGGPYKSHLINVIEASFYFSATLISSARLYELRMESNSSAATVTSTSISFAIFIVIVFYHVLQRITQTRRGARLKHSIKERVMIFVRQTAPTLNIMTTQPANNSQPIPHSSIELKEPLLSDIQ